MYNRKAGRALIVTLFIISLLLMGAGVFGLQFFMGEANAYRQSENDSEAFFLARTAEPFINTATDAPPYASIVEDEIAPLYYFRAP